MLDNKVYNLMMQIVQESKSLYRIRDQYCKDAGDDSTCEGFWKGMIVDKESHIKKMMELLKGYL